MQCPYCGSDSRVLDSRGSSDAVRRRRECLECERRFTTYEELAESEIKVVKRDGQSEPFSRDKLVAVVKRVTWDRTIAPRAAEDLVRGLEAELIDQATAAVPSAELARRLHRRLGELDALAATRFASNYLVDDGSIRFERASPSPQLDLPVVATSPSPDDPPRRKRRSR